LIAKILGKGYFFERIMMNFNKDFSSKIISISIITSLIFTGNSYALQSRHTLRPPSQFSGDLIDEIRQELKKDRPAHDYVKEGWRPILPGGEVYIPAQDIGDVVVRIGGIVDRGLDIGFKYHDSMAKIGHSQAGYIVSIEPPPCADYSTELLKSDPRDLKTEGAHCNIGRADRNHIRVADDYISKIHVQIVLEGDNVVIRDFNSTNGTFINAHGVTLGEGRGFITRAHHDELRKWIEGNELNIRKAGHLEERLAKEGYRLPLDVHGVHSMGVLEDMKIPAASLAKQGVPPRLYVLPDMLFEERLRGHGAIRKGVIYIDNIVSKKADDRGMHIAQEEFFEVFGLRLFAIRRGWSFEELVKWLDEEGDSLEVGQLLEALHEWSYGAVKSKEGLDLKLIKLDQLVDRLIDSHRPKRTAKLNAELAGLKATHQSPELDSDLARIEDINLRLRIDRSQYMEGARPVRGAAGPSRDLQSGI